MDRRGLRADDRGPVSRSGVRHGAARDETIRAYRDAVREGIGDESKALVDVRSPQEYSAS